MNAQHVAQIRSRMSIENPRVLGEGARRMFTEAELDELADRLAFEPSMAKWKVIMQEAVAKLIEDTLDYQI